MAIASNEVAQIFDLLLGLGDVISVTSLKLIAWSSDDGADDRDHSRKQEL